MDNDSFTDSLNLNGFIIYSVLAKVTHSPIFFVPKKCNRLKVDRKLFSIFNIVT